jgi:hypothetical protein
MRERKEGEKGLSERTLREETYIYIREKGGARERKAMCCYIDIYIQTYLIYICMYISIC